MKKKKIISTGIFIVVMAIAAGVAYYCYPSAINNALGINTAGINTISDSDFLTADSASSSFAAIDQNTGSDDVAMDVGAAAASSAYAVSPLLVQSSDGDAPSSVASATVGAVEDSDSGDGAMAQASSSPCAFPTRASAPASTTRAIIFNEIAWMGSPSSSIAEWMEIKNISSATVSLSGWRLLDASGKIKIFFTGSDGALAPGGLILFSRGTTTPITVTPAAKIYSGDLANTGDTLALMDSHCDLSDYLDASGGWPAGNNTTKQTLERDADGIGWHTSAQPGGTPGVENSSGSVAITTASTSPTPLPTPMPQLQNIKPTENTSEDTSAPSDTDVAASTSVITDTLLTMASTTNSGSDSNNSNSADNNAPTTTTPAIIGAANHVLIASVQIAGASSSNDLVELYNPTATAIDMSGWKLHKKSSTGADYSLKVFPARSVIAAGQSFAWANSEGGFSEVVGANVSSTETLAADNSVVLMDAAGIVVDAVAWGTGTNQYGEGPPYPTSPGANQLLSRRSSDGVMADTDENSNDFNLQ